MPIDLLCTVSYVFSYAQALPFFYLFVFPAPLDELFLQLREGPIHDFSSFSSWWARLQLTIIGTLFLLVLIGCATR